MFKWLIPSARASRKTGNSRLAFWRKEFGKVGKLEKEKICAQEAVLSKTEDMGNDKRSHRVHCFCLP